MIDGSKLRAALDQHVNNLQNQLNELQAEINANNDDKKKMLHENDKYEIFNGVRRIL